MRHTIRSTGEGRPRAIVLGSDLAYTLDFRGPVIRGLVADGHEVTVVCPPGADDLVRGLTAAKVGFIPWKVDQVGLNPFADIPAFLQLHRIIRRSRPDLLFAHAIKPSVYGLLAAALAGVPRRVAMLPGLGYAFAPGAGWRRRLTRAIASLCYRISLPWADTVIFQNEDDRDLFVARGMVRRDRAARVNGSGVDLARFAPAPLPSGPVTFVMVSRLLRDKGVAEFVEAAREVRSVLPDSRFVLLGGAHPNPNAVSTEELTRWREEGVVELPGWAADVAPWLAAAHVFVLPSYYGEGVPRSALEAMATGRALVMTDTPGCRDTVEHGRNGLLVRPRDAQDLASAMIRLGQDRALIRQMGERSRQICQARFGLSAVTAATLGHLLGVPPFDGEIAA